MFQGSNLVASWLEAQASESCQRKGGLDYVLVAGLCYINVFFLLSISYIDEVSCQTRYRHLLGAGQYPPHQNSLVNRYVLTPCLSHYALSRSIALTHLDSEVSGHRACKFGMTADQQRKLVLEKSRRNAKIDLRRLHERRALRHNQVSFDPWLHWHLPGTMSD